MAESLDRDLLVLLHDVARLLRTRFDQRAREHGATRAQWSILARLERQPGLSQNELAAILEVEPISVARLVDKLEERGFVERRADPNDRRIWRLHNLPAAKPALEKITRYRESMNVELLEGISPDLRESLIDALLNMKNHLTDTENMKLSAVGSN
ncbi:MAG TPA: MarR family transcriptional regulator [Rhizomicrobium sp.]|nr:MarR family transcriptional regulator [Rhizomicrobium sp.]